MALWQTKSGIPAEIQISEGSSTNLYGEQWAQDGSSTNVRAKIAFANAGVFLNDMLGFVSATGGNTFHRSLPEVCPRNPFQICTHCDLIQHYGHATQNRASQAQIDAATAALNAARIQLAAAFTAAAFTVALANYVAKANAFQIAEGWPVVDFLVYQCTFSQVPYRVADDNSIDSGAGPTEFNRFTYKKPRFIAREQSIPPGRFAPVGNPGLAVAQPGVRTISTRMIEYVWYKVPFINLPENRIDAYAGLVNGVAFDNKAPGTVLFHGAEPTPPYNMPMGVLAVDITYRFEYRKTTWHKFPDATGKLIELTLDGAAGGQHVYFSSIDSTTYLPVPDGTAGSELVDFYKLWIPQ